MKLVLSCMQYNVLKLVKINESILTWPSNLWIKLKVNNVK